jgi:hypothetical protein
MNSKERKIVDLLKDLKENYGLIGVKTEFEAEGAQLDELCRLKDVTAKADVGISLKIGGGEAATGIKMGRMLGVSRIVAPMIESPFALKKFVLCAKKIYSEDELQDVGLGVNIETITGYSLYEGMLALPEFAALDSVVYARGDMCGSLGKTFEHMDSDELRDMAADMFQRTKAKYPEIECMIGGVPSGKSFDFLRGIDPKVLDGYEGRKAIFEAPAQYDAKALEGFAKGIEFEILWCENKMEYYRAFATEDENKLKSLKSNYEATLRLR